MNGIAPMITMVAGIPSTGKSTVADHLANDHGYMSFDLERPQRWPTWSADPMRRARNDALHAAWDESRSVFVEILRHEHAPTATGIILDWGFPPALRSWVEELHAAGVDLVWFSGSEAVARERHRQSGKSVAEFDLQVRGIHHAGLPASLPEFRVVEAFEADGRNRAIGELCEDVTGLPCR